MKTLREGFPETMTPRVLAARARRTRTTDNILEVIRSSRTQRESAKKLGVTAGRVGALCRQREIDWETERDRR